jgi:NAD(P)H-nitrite reductase large subunit
MIEAARNHRRAVVIGGGLLGLEAAWGLKQRGMSVALVHLMPTLMERQLGECIEHNGQVFGLLAPIWEQAKVCAARLAGDDAAVYVPQPPFTSLKITGVDVFSAGALAAVDDCDEEITLHDAKGGIYKKVMSWSRSTANFLSA